MLNDDPAKVRKARPMSPSSPSRQDLQNWYPKSRKSECGAFEIALVLAGAVSAGAYTAGVMDFLFEALDEWYKHRDDHYSQDKLPNHNVKLRVITGASAGGINGAIAATACRYEFTPVTLKNAKVKGTQNPFYNTWVEEIDIHRLLDTSDIKKEGKNSTSPIRSLLNSESLDKLALSIVDRTWKTPKRRSWLADPFKLLLTVTNLKGVPYTVRFPGNTGLHHKMRMHRDHLGFMVPASQNLMHSPNTPPDVLPLNSDNSSKDQGWRSLAVASLASGAFPVALAARWLSRPGSDYDYRFVFPYAKSGSVVFSEPGINRSDPYTFAAVDGGTMNNEPFELARIELAGTKDRNPRKGHKACRAVIMIDPFTDSRQNTKPTASLLAIVPALLTALVSQTRFKQIDLTLAEADDIYSRFLIAPSRCDQKGCKVTGSEALASSGLEGFLGFFCKEYRHHDYMLGRRNCQRFLRDWFVLPSSQIARGSSSPKNNALFIQWPQGALNNQDFTSTTRSEHRQIIPLVGTAAQPQHQPLWPANKFDGYSDKKLKRKIKRRINALFPQLAKEVTNELFQPSSTESWLARKALKVAWSLFALKRKALDKIGAAIDQARNDVNSRA